MQWSGSNIDGQGACSPRWLDLRKGLRPLVMTGTQLSAQAIKDPALAHGLQEGGLR
jgi:hypothetical protein